MADEVTVTTPVPVQQRTRARYVVVSNINYQIPGENPRGPGTLRYSHDLRSRDEADQAYERVVRVSEEWVEVDLGWAKKCALLLLMNVATRLPGRTPTKEEKDEAAAKILQWGVSGPMGLVPVGNIPVGEATHFSPEDGVSIWVRCKSGQGRLSIFAVPE
jgi:hypothetical protein